MVKNRYQKCRYFSDEGQNMQNSDQNCRYLRVAPAGQPSVARLPAARLSIVGSPGGSPDWLPGRLPGLAPRTGSPDWPSGLPLRFAPPVCPSGLTLWFCCCSPAAPVAVFAAPPHYQGSARNSGALPRTNQGSASSDGALSSHFRELPRVPASASYHGVPAFAA